MPLLGKLIDLDPALSLSISISLMSLSFSAASSSSELDFLRPPCVLIDNSPRNASVLESSRSRCCSVATTTARDQPRSRQLNRPKAIAVSPRQSCSTMTVARKMLMLFLQDCLHRPFCRHDAGGEAVETARPGGGKLEQNSGGDAALVRLVIVAVETEAGVWARCTIRHLARLLLGIRNRKT